MISHLATTFRQLVKGRGVLFRNFTWIMMLRVVQQSLGLIAVYFLARGLETATFGTYGVFLSIIAICANVTLPGLNNAVTQCTARGHTDIFRRALLLGLLGGVLGSLICLAAWHHFLPSNPDLASAFLLAAVLFPASHGMLQWQSVLSGKEQFADFFWLGSLTALGTYSVIIGGVLLYPGEIFAPVLGVLGVPALVNAVMTVRMLRATRGGTGEPGAISYGLKTSIYIAINTVANHLDKVALYYFLSPEAVAFYVAADRVSELTKNAVQDFSAVLGPRFARTVQYTKGLDRKLKALGLVFSAGILAFTFTVFPWVLVTIFSERFEAAVPYAQGLMVSVAIGIHATLRTRYMTSKLDGASVRDVYVTVSVARIASTLALVPVFGLWGAVAGAFVYRLLSVALVQVAISKRHLVG